MSAIIFFFRLGALSISGGSALIIFIPATAFAIWTLPHFETKLQISVGTLCLVTLWLVVVADFAYYGSDQPRISQSTYDASAYAWVIGEVIFLLTAWVREFPWPFASHSGS